MILSRLLRGGVVLVAAAACVATTAPPTTREVRSLDLALDDPGSGLLAVRTFRITIDGHRVRYSERVHVALDAAFADAGSAPSVRLRLPDGSLVGASDGGFLLVPGDLPLHAWFVPTCVVGTPCTQDLQLQVQGSASPTPLAGPSAALTIDQDFDSSDRVPPGTLDFAEVTTP